MERTAKRVKNIKMLLQNKTLYKEKKPTEGKIKFLYSPVL
jgi:hypothetical protein